MLCRPNLDFNRSFLSHKQCCKSYRGRMFSKFNQLLQLMLIARRFGTMESSFEDDDSLTYMRQLLGYDKRRNDVIYIPKSQDGQPVERIVVYFGGDIQDFRENMRNNPEDKEHLQWSLENVAALLHQKFRSSHIVVIRPSRYDHGTFSCYDNFVPSGRFGIPSFLPYNKALQHLEQLLINLAKQINQNGKTYSLETKQNGTTQKFVELEKAEIKLIGFSKGCVVLNQFIRELCFLHSDNAQKVPNEKCKLASCILDMYFLDGGHAGRKDTWVTDNSLLQTFSTMGINVHIHVSPYQVKDYSRPWIGKEEKIFYETLRDQKCNVFRTLHFEKEKRSLDKHFEVLNSFV